MQGRSKTCSAADPAATADAHDPVNAASLVVGHPFTDAPTYGWAELLDFDSIGGKLKGTLRDVDPRLVR